MKIQIKKTTNKERWFIFKYVLFAMLLMLLLGMLDFPGRCGFIMGIIIGFTVDYGETRITFRSKKI